MEINNKSLRNEKALLYASKKHDKEIYQCLLDMGVGQPRQQEAPKKANIRSILSTIDNAIATHESIEKTILGTYNKCRHQYTAHGLKMAKDIILEQLERK